MCTYCHRETHIVPSPDNVVPEATKMKHRGALLLPMNDYIRGQAVSKKIQFTTCSRTEVVYLGDGSLLGGWVITRIPTSLALGTEIDIKQDISNPCTQNRAFPMGVAI